MQHGASGSTTTTVFLERFASRRLPTAGLSQKFKSDGVRPCLFPSSLGS